MKKIMINENQRGLLFKNGRFVGMLNPGKYRQCGGREIEVVGLEQPLSSPRCPLDTLLTDPALAEQVSTVEVRDQQLALHYADGTFLGLLPRGRYAFWRAGKEHTYHMVDTSDPEVAPEVPRHIFGRIPSTYYTRIEVSVYQKARLYFDRTFQRLLEPGTYFFWNTEVKVDVGYVDTRLTRMNVNGQEMLTLDKVTLRINFVCNYRITDYVKILTEIDDFEEQLHVVAQLALREYVGRYRLDELLENKEELSSFVLQRLKEREQALYVEITDAGVKDIILPGEIREIMNTVLVAEKRAQANVITRREEVASTRSLLNTARMMEENPTLYKLKELEYIERICENVGSIHLSGSGDLPAQLASVLRSNT